MKCTVCTRAPQQANSDTSECSHVDCPHRRKAWSERPTLAQLFRGPWPKKPREADPQPLDTMARSAT